ncbi:MAG TPA: triphosphoribosyl-dephospho-CoA synthase [Xanthobacteraceae bacterium]|nr:triphosphoribosyl-dephospho-CoA synthase [Xanthobacteraceae bacterium]
MSEAERIADAFRGACRAELTALKPGNVHVFADGHRMTAEQFVRSADAAAVPLSAHGARVGRRILDAVEATHGAVGTNTNLGIILLCAPLAAAAEADQADLRSAVAAVLDDLDTPDADLAFRAIVRAAPAGLGQVERHDVTRPALVTLRDAMADAADRDRVARQYVTAYEDIFDVGLPALATAAARDWAEEWIIVATYLGFLAGFPDSHIVRKYGAAVAEEVRKTAKKFHADLQSALHSSLQPSWDRSRLVDELLAWDAELKARNINPGTSADLTVATLFARRLATILPSARNSG